jgi:hypothetical protein
MGEASVGDRLRLLLSVALWAAALEVGPSPFVQVSCHPLLHPSPKGGGRCVFRARSFAIILAQS